MTLPAATAQALTARPGVSLALTVLLGLAIVWLGMGLAYFSVYPASCFITAGAFGIYLLVRLLASVRRRRTIGLLPPPVPVPDGVFA